MTNVAVKYEIKDFAALPAGTRFVPAYQYGINQEEFHAGLDWEKVYAELRAESIHREMVKIHFLASDGESREAGLSLKGLTSAIDPHEKVITGPPLGDLDRFGPDLPEDSIELLIKVLEAGAFKVDSDILPVPRSLIATVLDRPRTSAVFAHEFATESAGRISLTNLGILRALQELDKRGKL